MKLVVLLLAGLLKTTEALSAVLSSPRQQVVEEVRRMYADETSEYASAQGTGLTELSHSLQAASKAESSGGSDALIAAALLSAEIKFKFLYSAT